MIATRRDTLRGRASNPADTSDRSTRSSNDGGSVTAGSAALRRLHVPGVLARLGAVRRVRLTPEGFSLRDLRAGTRALIAAGVRVLVFSFHSPSVAPGFTPYVRDPHDRDEFLSRIDGFFKFFKEDCDGRSLLPDAVLAAAAATEDAVGHGLPSSLYRAGGRAVPLGRPVE